MNLTEIESRPEERCDSIRFDLDSIRLQFDADLVPILPNFKSYSIRFDFYSIRFNLHLLWRITIIIIIIKLV
jgi:hypothetical protein